MKTVIAVLTYHRPKMLEACVKSIFVANIPDNQDIELLIIDNAEDASAHDVAQTLSNNAPIPVTYYNEMQKGVVHARNRALTEGFDTHNADMLCFVDDDETVDPQWLTALLTAQKNHDADMVMGDVKFVLPDDAPPSVQNSAYFKRKRPAEGTTISKAYTGNLLIMKSVYETDTRFHPAFNQKGGEDHHFSREATKKRLKIIYTGHSVCHAPIPHDRVNDTYLLSHAYEAAKAAAVSDKILDGVFKACLINSLHIAYRVANFGIYAVKNDTVNAKRQLNMAKGRLVGLFQKP